MSHPSPSAPDHKSSSARPVGVFDSGIGGLTVARAIRDLLPNESIFYIGDTARVPYGGKSPATVQRYAMEIATVLAAENCKAIVVACNTASALALEVLQKEMLIPVIGVIQPGAAAAIAATKSGHIGVIGTRATINSRAYEIAIKSQREDVKVTSLACPLLVPLIEEGWVESEVTESVIRKYVQGMLDAKIDTLVLGCTHYPLLREAIQRVVGASVTLVDSAENSALALRTLLTERDITAQRAPHDPLHVALTDMPDHFLRVAQEALQLDMTAPTICELPQSARRSN